MLNHKPYSVNAVVNCHRYVKEVEINPLTHQPGLLHALVSEYGLGNLRRASAPPHGHHDVTRLKTDRGTFIVKRYRHISDVELYSAVETLLNSKGVRQARVIRTTDGALTSDTGYWVQESLPGTTMERPAAAESAKLMRYLAAYNRVLGSMDVVHHPGLQDTPWSQIATISHLYGDFPSQTEILGPDPKVIKQTIVLLQRDANAIASLPAQLVHADIGPSNILWHRGNIVALVDFTPYLTPRLYSIVNLLYWIHVYGLPTTDWPRIKADLDAYAELTRHEVRLLPSMLIGEALRRIAELFTESAAAGNKDDDLQCDFGPHYAALRSLILSLPQTLT